MSLVFAYLNFNNKSGTESRFILLYLNFHKSLIPTQSSLWFLTLRQRCDPFVPCLNFIKQEWNRAKIHFTIPKLLQVIDPLPDHVYGFIIFHIWTLSTTMKAEMWSVFAIFKIYQQEWNRVKIIFTMRKLLHVIGSLPDVYGETEMWSVFFHT